MREISRKIIREMIREMMKDEWIVSMRNRGVQIWMIRGEEIEEIEEIEE